MQNGELEKGARPEHAMDLPQHTGLIRHVHQRHDVEPAPAVMGRFPAPQQIGFALAPQTGYQGARTKTPYSGLNAI